MKPLETLSHTKRSPGKIRDESEAVLSPRGPPGRFNPKLNIPACESLRAPDWIPPGWIILALVVGNVEGGVSCINPFARYSITTGALEKQRSCTHTHAHTCTYTHSFPTRKNTPSLSHAECSLLLGDRLGWCHGRRQKKPFSCCCV